MDTSLLRIVIAAETDIVPVRSRTRRLAELIGFDAQDQTRITTAVSEIARNAYEYARGGNIEFRLTGEPPAQSFVIVARDRGPGIADLGAFWPVRTIRDGNGDRAAGRAAADGYVRHRVEARTGHDGAARQVAAALRAHITRRGWRTSWMRWRRMVRPTPWRKSAGRISRSCFSSRSYRRARRIAAGQSGAAGYQSRLVALYAELDGRADHLRRADELKSKFLSQYEP